MDSEKSKKTPWLTQESRTQGKERFAQEWKDFLEKSEKKVRDYLKVLAPSYRKIHWDAIHGTNKTRAIKAKCLDCTCWQPEEIKNCPAINCPLYKHRPYQGAELILEEQDNSTVIDF